MHSFMSQVLAHQHQEVLLREATQERMLKDVHKPTKRLSTQPTVLQHTSLSELDFAEIKRDLHLTLSEWCLVSEATGCEAVTDAFIHRLKVRLGYSK